ncbi:hypothetical protein GF312_13820 [Candidatus Poribacteria bacterium]|nr:hypothetical protein [Candidatus Poribacteria bacterium]
MVETVFGYHVLKVEDKKASQTKPLEEVKAQIVKKLKEDQASVEARQKADDIQYTIMSEESLQAAVDANPDLELKVQETGFFAKNDFIPQIGPNYTYKAVADEAFKLKEGEISNLVDVTSYGDRLMGYFIFKLIAKKPGGIPELSEVKDTVVSDLKKEKSEEFALNKAKAIMAELNNNQEFEKVAENNDLEAIESEPFTLNERGYIRAKSGAVNSKEVMLKSFGMKKDEVAGPLEGRNSVYIIKLIEYEDADVSEIAQNDEEKNAIRDQLLRQKEQKMYDSWYQSARKDIVIRSFIPSTS